MDIEATPRATSVDTGELYEKLRQRFLDVLRGCSPEQLATVVPATPAWRVRDALAHVVGITADLNALHFGPGTADAWTSAQVEQRLGDDVETMAAEWDREAARFEEGLRALGYEIGSHYVADLHAHTQDVRSALGLTPDRDESTVLVALDFYLASSSQGLTETGVGTVAAHVGAETHELGAGPVVATLTGAAFDVLRALSSRRSAAQIATMNWDGDSARVIPALSRYPLPMADIYD